MTLSCSSVLVSLLVTCGVANDLTSATCNETLWPDKDHDIVCSDCTVLVDNFNSRYGSCEGYCGKLGLECVVAYEEMSDDCRLKDRLACHQNIASSDAICTCQQASSLVNRPCNTTSWGGVQCNHDCAVLVSDMMLTYRTCDKFCRAAGLDCVGAWIPKQGPLVDGCVKAKSILCDAAVFYEHICECDGESTGYMGRRRWARKQHDFWEDASRRLYDRWSNQNCFDSTIDIDNDHTAPSGYTVGECAARCSAWTGCAGFVYQFIEAEYRVGTCWMRQAVDRYKYQDKCSFSVSKDVYWRSNMSTLITTAAPVSNIDAPDLRQKSIYLGFCVAGGVGFVCIVLLCGFLWRVHVFDDVIWNSKLCRMLRHTHTPESGESIDSSSDEDPVLNLHEIVPPEKWCVTLEQLRDFGARVSNQYPGDDPDGYQVVETVVKPATREAGTSYALMLNENGLQVTHFVTHAWAEGVKEFCTAVNEAFESMCKTVVESGLWICFLSNPQTWNVNDLDRLLGANPYMSPFYAAVRACEAVIAVRNPRVNMCERLWCVFELFEANTLHKAIYAVGTNPSSIDYNRVGSNARCSNERDTRMLRAAINRRGKQLEVDMYIERVIRGDTIRYPYKHNVHQHQGADKQQQLTAEADSSERTCYVQ